MAFHIEWPAGSELDALVAEKVMGWKSGVRGMISIWAHGDGEYTVKSLWAPSTSIEQAWEVLEKLKGRLELNRYDDGTWQVTSHADMRGSSVCMAICLAALERVGVVTT